MTQEEMMAEMIKQLAAINEKLELIRGDTDRMKMTVYGDRIVLH